MVSLSAHKVYGPKGVGALYIRRGHRIRSFFDGGSQEHGKRGGTYNVPAIVGFGKAAEMAVANLEAENRRLQLLRDRLIDAVLTTIDRVWITGSRNLRLSNNVHICVEGVEGESLLLALDFAGICASAGSACSTGATEPSHVLKAMGVPLERGRGAVRLTLGKSTTEASIDYTAMKIRDAVIDLRQG